MKQRIVIILAGALFFSLFYVTGRALAGDIKAGPPHIIGLALEPESVTVESPVKVTVTFIPCVDVESLSISFKILPEPDAQVLGALQHSWHGKGKKGQAITFSWATVFHRPGNYVANVAYEHRDPAGFATMVRDGRGFIIRVPGGIQQPGRIDDLFPLHLKIPRTLIGLASDSGDTVGGVRPLERVKPDVRDSGGGRRLELRGLTPMGGDSLRFGLGRQRCPPHKARMSARSGGTFPDSVASGFVSSALSPPCGDTFQVIATCDILLWMEDQYGNILDASNWRVVPSWLGSMEELPDHRARFTAGSSPGIGNIWCDYGGYSYYQPVMVIANYHLEGSFLYKDRNLSEDLPAKRTQVALYTADPQGNDLVLAIDDEQVRFRFIRGTYTSDSGFYQFDNLNVDSIAVLLLTEYPSHEVGYVCGGHWCWYGWYYAWFGFECLMHYLAPSVSAGSRSAGDDTRGALNIMSFTHTGVDYVAGLPGSYFPEKVIMLWNPNDAADTTSFYLHEGIMIGGQVYDLIRAAGLRDWPYVDEWDQDVFLHEYGHFVMDNYAALPPVGPKCEEHQWHVPSGDECAYAEGWATFYSCACQNDKVYLDTNRDGSTYLRIDVELPEKDPQGTDVEGAVCASLWDVFDYPNDGTVWGGDRWCHNNDQNANLLWQCIDEIWWALGQPGDLGHFPYTVCDFTYIWAWSGYPIDEIWRNIFNAHGIECTPVGVKDELASTSNATPFLWPNHPNPFNPATRICFRIVKPEIVSLLVFDTSGELVRTLVNSNRDPGTYTIWWDGTDDSGRFLASGVYFCHLVAGSFRQARKLVVLK
jgi:hypothetical protein